MYSILRRKTEGVKVGKWTTIWDSEDGADTAKYLKTLVQNAENTSVEYMMVYKL